MALFIPGMQCVLSGRTITSVNEAVMFPPFVSNEADELFVFSDAVVHADIFREHPLASRAQARYEEFHERMAPANRLCVACGQRITDPDDYLCLGHLIADSTQALHRFNYAHFHRSCLSRWPELPVLICELKMLSATGAWKGVGLEQLIREISREALSR